MLISSTTRRRLERLVLPLLLAFNLLLLGYYLAIDYQYAVHSDSAVMNLLAQEIHDTGQFFPRGWNYANGDLWVWFPHTLIVALLPWLPNSYALHALSGAVTAALVLLGAWCVGGMLGQSRLARLVTLLVLSAGISANMAENLYGQAAYGVLFYLACFLAYSAWRMLRDGTHAGARRRWGALFALLVLLVFWSNPQRAAVFYGLPLILAGFSLLLLPGQPQAQLRLQRRRLWTLLALLLAALLAGTALHGHYVKLVGNSGLAPATWLGFDGMVRNVLGTLRGLLSLLGGLPPEGGAVINAAGAWSALRLLAALALLGLLPWALRRAFRAPVQPARVFFAVFTLTSVGINLLVALTTSLADMAVPEASARYLVPSLLCMLMLLTGLAVDHFHWRRPLHMLALLALLVTGLSAPLAYKVDNSPGYFNKDGVAAHSPYLQLAQYLQQQGLHYGYASFWNAGIISLLSEQRVQTRQITIENGLPMPVRHLSSDRWYEAVTWDGPTFLLLTFDESKAMNWEQVERYSGPPSRILNFHGCLIRIYPRNLAAVMPLWDPRQAVPLRFPVSAASLHGIGHLTDNDRALQSEPGETGHLQFGPGRPTAAGRYLVHFDLETSGAGVHDFGVVDVTVNHGATVLAALPIRASGAQRITLPLTLGGPAGDLEFRVWSNAAGTIKTKGVDLTLQPLRGPAAK